MTAYRLSLLACLLLLAGCSNDSTPKEPEKTTGHVWQGQVEMLNEAKAVSQQVNEIQQRKEEQYKNLD